MGILSRIEPSLDAAGERRPISVTELTRRIKDAINLSPQLGRLWVRGEISNFKRHVSGHVYFSLKDTGSLIRAVIFRNRAERLRFSPQEGQAVLAFGQVGVYETSGQYQIYVEELEPFGRGALYQEFERLKARLENEGLFDPAAKRPLPWLPVKVGVVTSPAGAVIRDIISVSRRRFPNCHLVLAPVAVQGEAASEQVARAIGELNRVTGIQVIILARGGGSLEELWPFNTEAVARAIRASGIPVVSAVGHETDFTIADFAADWRAPTPSAAAERVFPERRELEGNLASIEGRLRRALLARARLDRSRLAALAGSRALTRPEERLNQWRQRLDDRLRQVASLAVRGTVGKRAEFNLLVGRLETLSPLGVLARGYSLCTRASSGELISSYHQVVPGDAVRVKLSRGGFDCRVEVLRPGGDELGGGDGDGDGEDRL